MALTDGLELAINFNSDVLDKSGNGRHGIVTGMTYDTSTPIIGSGTGVFDGINDDVEIDVATSPQSDILALTVGTLAFWVRFPTLVEFKNLFTITEAGQSAPNGDEWMVFFRGVVNKNIQIINIVSGVTTSALSSINAINDNNKHLIVFRADGIGNVELFVDDVPISFPGTLGSAFFGSAINADTMRIGSREGAAVDYRGDKDIDALAIWNRPLSDAEGTEYWNIGNGVELDLTGLVILRRRMEGY